MNLVRRETRVPVLGAAFEPFSLMRGLMRWDPFRDEGLQGDGATFLPSFDIKETKEGYVFTADLPGIRQEDLDINLTGSRLSISGKREAEARQEGENLFIAERSFGAFCRTFNLPEGIDAGNVKAELKDGVLKVTVPKVPEVQPRRITISH
jgi:HSP20 family protein